MWDTLWLDGNLATMTAGGAPYGAILDGALATKDGRIAWVGTQADLPGAPTTLAREIVRIDGWMTPGLVDCHTHLVFAGNRAREFELRLQGASYEAIARSGGGILSTVEATRAARVEDLADDAAARLARMGEDGLTTVEIKSGYGLDLESELKQLEAARRIGQQCAMRVRRTFLGLHALPREYRDDRSGYVDLVADVMVPAVAAARAADAVDVFCESIGFTRAEAARVFEAARRHGLAVKIHAEQLSNQHGAALAAECGALSADHLEWLDDAGVAAMAQAGTVAVLLPGAYYFMRETRSPPIDKLRAAGVAMAVATDCNPGTSPLGSPLAALNLACTLFRFTPEEALAGMTRCAGQALGLQDEIGTLQTGKAADLAIWDIDEPAELSYWLAGPPRLRHRVFAGQRV